MRCRLSHRGKTTGAAAQVPYLPLDPKDIGRSYARRAHDSPRRMAHDSLAWPGPLRGCANQPTPSVRDAPTAAHRHAKASHPSPPAKPARPYIHTRPLHSLVRAIVSGTSAYVCWPSSEYSRVQVRGDRADQRAERQGRARICARDRVSAHPIPPCHHL